jgi:hypothetical protein
MDRSRKDLQITYNDSLQPLGDLLGDVKRPGEYFTSGTHETPMPALFVKGMGAVSFPVPPPQSRKLVSVAERAPYGRGDNTLVDEGVRKVWQIAPQLVSLGGKGWERSLKALTARVEVELGCEPRSVAAEFYKLLIYDQGGFFVAHRDTEKAPGMFGTLVVALPSAHEGGDLLVRHAGRESVVSLCNSDPGEVRYASFYADCEHEVRPVTSGHRICLVYNLVQTARSGLPVPPDNRHAAEGAAKLLEPWTAPGGEPRKLVYLLEHRYTQAALSFAGLKGADAARAAVLKEAAARVGCALHLGIVHIEESGWAEYSGGGYHSRGRSYRGRNEDDETEDNLDDAGDDEDFEIGEVCDGRYFIAEWRDASDRPVAFGEIPLEDDEVLPVGALNDAKPDEQHFAEATGNEGASFERTYLRAGLVLWPQERFDEVCASGGLDATIARFGQLVAEAVDARDPAPAGSEKARRARVSRFAKLFPEEWPQFEDHGARLDVLLGHMALLGNAALIETLAAPALARHYAAGRNPALAACARALGPERGRFFFTGLLAAVAPTHPGSCLDLWSRLADRAFSGHRAELEALLDALIAAAPKARKPAKPLRLKRFGRDFLFPEEEGVDDDTDEFAPAKDSLTPEALAAALGVMGGALGTPACLSYIGAMAGNADAFAPETLLLPMLENVAKDSGASLVPPEAVARVWEHCATFYLERSAAPPPQPRDWAQSAKIAGSGADPLLRELQAFARDPNACERRFPAATAQRALLHQAIERAGLDMTHVTERRGRPYTLVCRKTRATHARALRRYRSDLADMRRLLALPAAQAPENAPATARLWHAAAAS